MNMDANVFGKALDAVNTMGKVAANLTENKKQSAPQNNPPKQDKTNTNQPHTQTVEVKVGDPDRKEKPVVVHEKNETHVHKAYPDGRALSKDECEVEKIRINTAHENNKEEREYQLTLERERRAERREREEYERGERERRLAEKKKSDRRFWTIFGIFAAASMVGIGYCLYTDYRTSRAAGLPVPEPKISVSVTKQTSPVKTRPSKPIKAEGTVK
jgi:hypothetical protein